MNIEVNMTFTSSKNVREKTETFGKHPSVVLICTQTELPLEGMKHFAWNVLAIPLRTSNLEFGSRREKSGCKSKVARQVLVSPCLSKPLDKAFDEGFTDIHFDYRFTAEYFKHAA